MNIPTTSLPVPPSAFRRGGTFTVGVEEELLLVGRRGRPLGAAGRAVTESVVGQVGPHGSISGELYLDQIELATSVCDDGGAVGDHLAALRRHLTDSGARALAIGVHPAARADRTATTRSERYDPIAAEMAGLLRTPVAALQVHVALPDPETAIAAYRSLRNWLPVLRALAADSPFWFGRDSGLASARAAILRSYPRVGSPPVFASYDQYVETVEELVAAASVPDYTHVWWDLRPHPRFGTLEVRVMDAQWSVARTAGLTTLVQGLARHAVEAPDGIDVPPEVLASNDFRAWRYGLDGSQAGIDGVVRPVRQLGRTAVAQARAMLAADGLDAPLAEIDRLLSEPSESDRQRRIVQGSGVAALARDLMARTAAGGAGS